ncbi:MAG TPA: Holliday junction resolvase-like protein [archaeon]|nr:Holliday junction resolvase-like protein [archaeon]
MIDLTVLIIVSLIGVIFYLVYKNKEWSIKFEQRVKEWLEKEERNIREDAIARSARTLSGKTLERLIPFLEKFKHDPHDVKWLGDPIDLVVFDGYSKGDPKKITFLEVKSGDSKLSTNQKKIKELVDKKKVEWEEFRI